MTCRMDALRDKEVINVKDGGRMGFVGDVEVDVGEAKLTAGQAEVVWSLGKRTGSGDPLGKDRPHRGGYRAGGGGNARSGAKEGVLSKSAGKIGVIASNLLQNLTENRRKKP